jgi:hypothetical protein
MAAGALHGLQFGFLRAEAVPHGRSSSGVPGRPTPFLPLFSRIPPPLLAPLDSLKAATTPPPRLLFLWRWRRDIKGRGAAPRPAARARAIASPRPTRYGRPFHGVWSGAAAVVGSASSETGSVNTQSGLIKRGREEGSEREEGLRVYFQQVKCSSQFASLHPCRSAGAAPVDFRGKLHADGAMRTRLLLGTCWTRQVIRPGHGHAGGRILSLLGN